MCEGTTKPVYLLNVSMYVISYYHVTVTVAPVENVIYCQVEYHFIFVYTTDICILAL